MVSGAFWGVSGLDKQSKSLKNQLSAFDERIRTKITKRAVGKALRVIRDGIRDQVPPKFAEIKRLIGERLVLIAGQSDLTQGIVGAGVGSTNKLADKHRTHSGGVGIGGKNIHWFIVGTKERHTSSGRSTGSMPPQVPDVVRNGFEASKASAVREFMTDMQRGIDEERQKVYAAIRKASAE